MVQFGNNVPKYTSKTTYNSITLLHEVSWGSVAASTTQQLSVGVVTHDDAEVRRIIKSQTLRFLNDRRCTARERNSDVVSAASHPRDVHVIGKMF